MTSRIAAVLLWTGLLAAAPPTDRFFDDYSFPFHPTQATSQGFHQYDQRLEDYSKATIDKRVSALRRLQGEFEAIAPSIDRDMLLSQIKAERLELETVRPWEKNPDTYSSGISNSVFVLMSRRFAPAADRLKSVIARERQMPSVFVAARVNLKNPPKVYTQVALEQLPGIAGFFEKDVPAAFTEVKDKELLAEFTSANRAVIEALRSYEQWLKTDLLPRSNGDFRLGADAYRKKLLYDEMVDTPVEELLKIGYRDLRKNQEAFLATAARIDPARKAIDVFSDLEKEHPAPEKLLQAFRDVLGGLREFLLAHKIVTIPSEVPPIVEETPPFERALTTASMDTPGPFEKVATEAYFNVTLPDPAWSHAKVEDHMTSFYRGVILSTAIHEVYPGHYLQFLWTPSAPSKVRKLLGCGTNAEGWAHYTEQMMLDEGYGNGDPKLRLGQLQDALLRDARYIVGIEMHTGKMTFEQGVEFFVKEGYQPRINAERETKRGTSDPTYLVYTLGKLEILKLREDYKKLRGDKYTLREFHDNFLRQGFPPLKIVRREMLGNDSPVL